MIARLTEEGLKAWPEAGTLGTAGPVEYPRSTGIDLVGLNRRMTYAALYLTQPWIHTVVNKLARGVARLDLQTYRLRNRDRMDKELKLNHELARLLARPFPKWGSGFYLKEAITGSLAIYGHSLCVKQRTRGPGSTPDELWPVNFAYVSIIGSDDSPIEYYEYRKGGIVKQWLPDEVVHHMWWGPGGLGVSPMEPLRRTLAMEDAAQRYAVSSFANAARPSGFVRTEQKLQKTDRELLKAEIEATHGGPDNAFKIALLTHGLDWTPASHSAQEAEVINHRKLNREEVCAVYDIPPPIVHILDRATFSNIDEQHIMWYQDTLGPWIEMEADGFNVQLIEPESSWGNMTVEFSLDKVLKGDADKRATTVQKFFQSATRTPNENRRSEGLDPIGDPDDKENPANQIYVPVNMVGINGDAPEPVEIPVGSGENPDLAPGVGGGPADVAQAISAGVATALKFLRTKQAIRQTAGSVPELDEVS